MNDQPLVLLAPLMVSLMVSSGIAWATPDATRGQETFHKWVQVYDHQPDTVYVDQASLQREKPSSIGEITAVKHHQPSAAANGLTNRTEVNHVKVNCLDKSYSVRFQAEYLPNGQLTKTQSFDDQREFQKPSTDSYFREVIDFVCGQIHAR